MEAIKRERKVDVEKMDIAQVDELSKQLGQRISQIADEAGKKINEMLAIYGLETKIQILNPYKKEVALSSDKITEN